MAGFFLLSDATIPLWYPAKEIWELFYSVMLRVDKSVHIKAETVAIFLNCPKVTQILPEVVHVNFIVEWGFPELRSYFVRTFSATLNVLLLLLDVWYRGDDIYWKPSLFIVGHLERQPFPTGDSWIQMHTTYQAFLLLRSRIGCLLIWMMFSLHHERYHSCNASLEKRYNCQIKASIN